MPWLKNYLHSLTMYQVVTRNLLFLLGTALLLSLIDRIPFQPSEIVTTLAIAFISCWVFQAVFSRLFRAPSNRESWQITALILALILGPGTLEGVWLPLTVATGTAMLSKFALRFGGRHLFNPAAFGVVAMALMVGSGSSWWVGIWPLTVVTLVGGLVVTYKIRRISTAATYIGSYLLFFVGLNGIELNVATNGALLQSLAFDSPLIFLATVMLIEPATSPTGQRTRHIFALIAAAAAALTQRFIPDIAYSFELSILVGNIATRAMERHNHFVMTLTRREKLSSSVESFFFEPSSRINFRAGQFLEWSIPHLQADSRGTRRWFTIASAPTEPLIQLTTRFSDPPSTLKTALRSLKVGEHISAHGLEGDFTMPADRTKALVFIAGGIGITPFRSMLKFLIDSGEARDITLFYAAREENDLVFRDIIASAEEAFGLKYVPILSKPDSAWQGERGQLTPELLKRECPDIERAAVFVSGPEPMVESLTVSLRGISVPNSAIHQDFFPGYQAEDHGK